MLKRYIVTLFLVLLIPAYAFASEEVQEEGMAEEEFLSSLNYQDGNVSLPGNKASLNMPESFRYLSPEDTEKVLVQAWGNPPGSGSQTLGMIVPADVSVLDDAGWAAVISYEEEGHVSDDDADSIKYDELLSGMQEDTRAANKERVEAGYEPIELVGWAAPPRYDKETHKLYWAKELKFGEAETNTLNYNVRILGRKGVLVLNFVASMPQLSEIESATPGILAMTDFNPGNKYTDFDPSVDKLAAYGIGALVAGKLAAKAGIFAKLGGLLIAFKKLWIAVVIAVGAFVKKIFGGRGKKTVQPEESQEQA